MRTYNLIVVVAAVIGAVLFLYYPERVLLIVVVEIAFSLLLWFVTMKPVHEPDRALVYRLAKFHHVAGPGYIFLVPTLDHIVGQLDMRPKGLDIEVPNVSTADNQHVRTNLEVTWRIHPDVQGKVTSPMRHMILMEPDRREKIVHEQVILIARQVVSSYTRAQLTPAPNREAAMATMADGVNEILEPQGLLVDHIFWRGSGYPAKLSEAKVESLVQLEQAEALISTVEAIRKRLPDMQPEEFLALQAWLDTFRRGGFGGRERPPAPSS